MRASISDDKTEKEPSLAEQEILVQSVCETMVPKLVAEDIPLLFSLMTDVFPGINYKQGNMDALKKIVADVCREKHLVCGMEEEESGHSWTEKVGDADALHTSTAYYRVTTVVSYLGWVDFDLGVPTSCPIGQLILPYCCHCICPS